VTNLLDLCRMVRLPLACTLAVVLALAGGAVEYDAITRSSPLKLG